MGPPGTGKTRVAALFIAAALRLGGGRGKKTATTTTTTATTVTAAHPPTSIRILAVAHSNGAADVLLEALLQIGVPAVRGTGWSPASVSPAARHRTVIAMAETHPDVVAMRQQIGGKDAPSTSDTHNHVKKQVCETILSTAPVVVASCVGAQQLVISKSESISFPIVVVDEASQTTEPALLCALAAAKAERPFG